MQGPDTIRAFVAIELPPEAIGALRDVQDGLRRRAAALDVADEVRWVAPEGAHLTLKFLGNVPAIQIPSLTQALQTGLDGQERFSLALGDVGVFPRPSAPRVLWVGVAGALPSLHETQRRVETALAPHGYPTEARPFAPHLTLGRIRETAGTAQRRALGSLTSSPVRVPQLRWEVAEVSLMHSELGRGGARYTRIAAIALA